MTDDVKKPEEEVGEETEDTDRIDKVTAKLEEKVSDLENQVKRVLADYQNLVKRVDEERKDWIRVSNRELLLRILPVLDTLILASKHSKDQSLTVSTGMFQDILKSEGVKQVETVGKKFDPMTMEAIGIASGEEGKVIEEVRTGYMMLEKLLRPAQVIVGGKKQETN